jgi:hypothetical protein
MNQSGRQAGSCQNEKAGFKRMAEFEGWPKVTTLRREIGSVSTEVD